MKTPSANLAALLGLAVSSASPRKGRPEGPNDPETRRDPDAAADIPLRPTRRRRSPTWVSPSRDPFLVFEEMIQEGPASTPRESRLHQDALRGRRGVPADPWHQHQQQRRGIGRRALQGSAELDRRGQPAEPLRDGKEWTTAAFTDVLDIMGAASRSSVISRTPRAAPRWRRRQAVRHRRRRARPRSIRRVTASSACPRRPRCSSSPPRSSSKPPPTPTVGSGVASLMRRPVCQ